MDKVNLILDTDIGSDIDDLYALYLALLHPRINLMAVTTVDGDTQARARLVGKVLRQQGRTDIRIGAGELGADAEHTHTQFVTDGDPEHLRVYPPAMQVVTETLRNADGPVAIAPIGAQTNVAAFLDSADSSLLKRVSCIAMMGGETETSMAEYNVLRDVRAADAVFRSGIPIFAGTYSQCTRVYLTLRQVETLFGGSEDPIRRTLLECTRMWSPWVGTKPGAVLYDLLPVFWLADPSLIRIREIRLRVETQDSQRLGYTVPDESGGLVHESVDLDPAELLNRFLEIIGCPKSVDTASM